jgi:prepilin-type N-terminal cleavage/methylation domain-containing protein
MHRKRTSAFTMVEMMVASTIFAIIFGLCGMLYVQSTWRTANALELNKVEGQVRDLDRFLENSIQNATSCTTVSRGLPLLSATSLKCVMPANGSSYNQFGSYSSYTPSSCSSGAVHWGTGLTRYIFFSDNTGKYPNGGSYLWEADMVGPANPDSPHTITNFTYYNGNTNIYNWFLIDNFTYTINANNSVTYTIHATDLTRTGAAMGTSTDTANSHTCQLTRTVYWRNSVT